MEINTYKNIKSPDILTTVDINEWVKTIKNPEKKYKDLILEARKVGKGNKRYDKIKTTSLPCVTYNFIFAKRKLDKNIVQPTGLLFIDIDEKIDLGNLNIDNIYIIYKSLNGEGFHIIVKVDNLTKENFNIYYQNILRELDLLEYYDDNARKKTQFSVLSYDENLIINDECKTFDFSDEKYNTKQSKENEEYKKEEYIDKKCTNTEKNTYIQLITSNINDIRHEAELDNGDTTFKTNFENGWKHIECVLPSQTKCKIGKRNSSLLSFFNNLVWLNPEVPHDLLFERLKTVNNMLNDPLALEEIIKISKSVFRYKNDGTLKPIYRKKNRKIVFSKNCKFSKEEKFDTVRLLVSENRCKEAIVKLKNIVENWDIITCGKISQTKICKLNKISKQTVNKYWSEVALNVKQINDNFNEYNKKFKNEKN